MLCLLIAALIVSGGAVPLFLFPGSNTCAGGGEALPLSKDCSSHTAYSVFTNDSHVCVGDGGACGGPWAWCERAVCGACIPLPGGGSVGASRLCGTSNAPIWGQYGGDALHTGRSIESAPLTSIQSKWTYDPVNEYYSIVVGADGTVYAVAWGAQFSQTATALTPGPSHATLLFSVLLPFANSGYSLSLSFDSSVLYARVSQQPLQAYNASTGAALWASVPTNVGVMSAGPTGSVAFLQVSFSNMTLFCVNGVTGAVQWQLPQFFDSYGTLGWSANGSIVYFVTNSKTSTSLNAYYAATGVKAWTSTPTGMFGYSFGPCVLPRDRIAWIPGMEAGSVPLLILDANSGNVLVSVPSFPAARDASVGPDGTLYVSYANQVLGAVSPDTGEVLWTAPFAAGWISYGVVVANNSVLLGAQYMQTSGGGSLTQMFAVHAATGAIIWVMPLSYRPSGPVLGADGVVLYSLLNGVIAGAPGGNSGSPGNTAAIAGGVVGGCVAVGLLVYCVWRRRHNAKPDPGYSGYRSYGAVADWDSPLLAPAPAPAPAPSPAEMKRRQAEQEEEERLAAEMERYRSQRRAHTPAATDSAAARGAAEARLALAPRVAALCARMLVGRLGPRALLPPALDTAGREWRLGVDFTLASPVQAGAPEGQGGAAFVVYVSATADLAAACEGLLDVAASGGGRDAAGRLCIKAYTSPAQENNWRMPEQLPQHPSIAPVLHRYTGPTSPLLAALASAGQQAPQTAPTATFVVLAPYPCTLSQWLRGKELGEAEWLALALQVFEGLALLRGQGVAHRSVTPAAVCVDANDRLVFTHFGTALALRQGAPLPLTSPSQAAAVADPFVAALARGAATASTLEEAYDKCDVYAAGSMMLALMGGDAGGEARAPSLPPSFSPSLRAVLCACIAAEPSRRPSAQAVWELLACAAFWPGGAVGGAGQAAKGEQVGGGEIECDAWLAGQGQALLSSGGKGPLPPPLAKAAPSIARILEEQQVLYVSGRTGASLWKNVQQLRALASPA